MIYESDLSQLLSKWESRLSECTNPSYKDALYDCIYELRATIDKAHKAEEDALTYEDALESILIDEALANKEFFNDFIY